MEKEMWILLIEMRSLWSRTVENEETDENGRNVPFMEKVHGAGQLKNGASNTTVLA